MNSANLSQIFEHYISRFDELNDPQNREYYKWEIAARFRPVLDEALSADNADLPAKLAAAVLLTAQTIDNRYELSFYALTDYAKKEPDAVRVAISALLTPDDGDLLLRQQRFADFLDFCHAMQKKYNPDSWRYTASIKLPMMITGYYDPDNYYLYKASQARAYADCVEFYDDWGSGANIDLRVYHRMCDELAAAIRNDPALTEISQKRHTLSQKPMHLDGSCHLFAFDIIFCSTVYNLYEGIHYSVRNTAEKKAYSEKKKEADIALVAQSEALELAAKLDGAEAFFTQKLSIGSEIIHKSFGIGQITDLPNEYTVTAVFPASSTPIKLSWRVCITSGIISFRTEENAAEYDEMVSLLRRADIIRKSVALAEQKLQAYQDLYR